MSILHVLLPPRACIGDARAFMRWLAHGDRATDAQGGREATLRRLFRFAGDTVPVAALRHHAHAGDAPIGTWVAADPAHVRGEATGARLLACPITDLAASEADALATALRPLFGDAGTALAVDTPSAWCLQRPVGVPRARFTAPVDALGVDLLACLPDGSAARWWRRLFNEAQVILHAHPVNSARVATGRTPVNALWFWGAGALPGGVATPLAHVATDDSVLLGLARLAGVARVECSLAGVAAVAEAGDVLLDLGGSDGEDAPAVWLPSFKAWLRERRFGTITCAFADGGGSSVRHAHRLRFWRRG